MWMKWVFPKKNVMLHASVCYCLTMITWNSFEIFLAIFGDSELVRSLQPFAHIIVQSYKVYKITIWLQEICNRVSCTVRRRNSNCYVLSSWISCNKFMHVKQYKNMKNYFVLNTLEHKHPQLHVKIDMSVQINVYT